ncbi:LOW QUALITY PROTEIN: hypothetical protein PanWU01x14_014020 [Parasponia andersonii]|uniref:Uncharacterized protein n=1 Tax=Parasponia andersonii TaxID=3476 RepID=A0A2P5E185_PARAD|nr:LOW QUALITY PROTEIN: hypothetical protein PanWU01x14_014020 [Parasponia andersonii]
MPSPPTNQAPGTTSDPTFPHLQPSTTGTTTTPFPGPFQSHLPPFLMLLLATINSHQLH